jgi:hypothetical protein
VPGHFVAPVYALAASFSNTLLKPPEVTNILPLFCSRMLRGYLSPLLLTENLLHIMLLALRRRDKFKIMEQVRSFERKEVNIKSE